MDWFDRIQRRGSLAWIAATAALPFAAACGSAPASAATYRISHSEAEWRKRLTKQQYAVLREHATERAFSSPLDDEKRKGVFACAGCENRLFSSDNKFDSGTGWPSFWQPIDSGAVGFSTDFKLGYPRREVHCADCGGHLGHLFDDGPRPTGKRYCMNGVAMKFIPA